MNAEGHILITEGVRTIPPDVRYTFIANAEWEGGPIARLSLLLLVGVLRMVPFPKVGEAFSIGPLRLRCIAVEVWSGHILVVRDDRLAWWYIVRHWLQREGKVLKSRIILTLAVWNLAKWNNDTMPQWGDIHAVRWLYERWQR